ncbi:MAG: archaeosortase/exosortase family protein [Candidatus Kapaibacterium sp.]
MANLNKKYNIFLVKYIVVIISYYLLLMIPNNFILEQYLRSTAFFSSLIINLFTEGVRNVGDVIMGNNFSVQISFGCEGTEPMILFVAGVLAFDTKIKKKAIGVLSGIILLYILNLVRIVILFFVGSNDVELFVALHDIYLQLALILIALSMLLFWINYAKK